MAPGLLAMAGWPVAARDNARQFARIRSLEWRPPDEPAPRQPRGRGQLESPLTPASRPTSAPTSTSTSAPTSAPRNLSSANGPWQRGRTYAKLETPPPPPPPLAPAALAAPRWASLNLIGEGRGKSCKSCFPLLHWFAGRRLAATPAGRLRAYFKELAWLPPTPLPPPTPTLVLHTID